MKQELLKQGEISLKEDPLEKGCWSEKKKEWCRKTRKKEKRTEDGMYSVLGIEWFSKMASSNGPRPH